MASPRSSGSNTTLVRINRQQHPKPGQVLVLNLENLHFIGWEMAFAFDRLNVKRSNEGKLEWSAYQFSKHCGVSPSTLYKLFNGQTQCPRLTTIIKIGMKLGYTFGMVRD